MNLKKTMKQISAFALALVLICTLVPTAFAADRDTSKKCSLTIYKYEYNGTAATVGTGEDNQTVPTDNTSDATKADVSKTAKPLAGVTFQYIKVGDLANLQHTDTYGLVWEQAYKLTNSALAGILSTKTDKPEFVTYSQDEKTGVETGVYTGTALTTALATAVEKKKNNLEALTGLTSMEKTDSTGKVQATNLDQGLYLVVETNVPHNVTSTTAPFLVSLPMAKYDEDRTTTNTTAQSANDQGTGWNYNVVVYPKNQTGTPELTKAVKEAADTAFKPYVNTAAGDVLTYQLTTKIPKIASTVTYLNKYEFVDTLPAGMLYVKDTGKVNATSASEGNTTVTVQIGNLTWTSKDSTEVEKADKTKENKPYFKIAYDDTKRTMTITLTPEGLAKINPDQSEKDVTITYTAKIDKVGADQAVMGYNNKDGNKNTVTLTYSRSDDSSKKVLDSEASAFTYGMKLTKTFSDAEKTVGETTTKPDKEGDPTKVQFTVTDKAGNYIIAKLNDTQKKKVDGVATEADEEKPGEYTVIGRQAPKVGDPAKDYKPTVDDNTVFSPDETGLLFLKGLDEGEYKVTEIKTDDGYKILQAPITMVIKGVSDKTTESTVDGETVKETESKGTAPSATVTITENKAGKDNGTTSKTIGTDKNIMAADGTSTNAIVPFTVVNEPADLVNFVLPQTGGLGSIVFTLLGAVVFAGALLMLKKSKKNKNC